MSLRLLNLEIHAAGQVLRPKRQGEGSLRRFPGSTELPKSDQVSDLEAQPGNQIAALVSSTDLVALIGFAHVSELCDVH
jgi:hypothetical protein